MNNQCLRITFLIETLPKNFLHNVIKKKARDLELEGTVQTLRENQIKIVICGKRDSIDDFLDVLHKEASKQPIENMEIEPFLKEKDYRGVFRVIE